MPHVPSGAATDDIGHNESTWPLPHLCTELLPMIVSSVKSEP